MNINFNEGGWFLTFFFDSKRRRARLWFKPDFWRPSEYPLFEREWKW